jgi:hypothetical protein
MKGNDPRPPSKALTSYKLVQGKNLDDASMSSQRVHAC